MDTFKVLDAGLLTTVQDLGRYGYQRYGVSPSGVMDEFSAVTANLLVGNSEEDALLETTMKGVSLEFLKDAVISITGAECDAKINDEKISLWRSYKVSPGDKLKMGIARNGLRNYIAFHGGIDVPVVMKSRATNLRANLGGFQGRKLENNDVLKVFDKISSDIIEKQLLHNLIPKYSKEMEVGIILGQQHDHFELQGIETFFKEPYTVTQESDRMGIRLNGNEIKHLNGADIISDGITFGAVQVPGNGQPIVMMADRQTTGGYTKIGNVATADLPKLAQAVPGTRIKFYEIALEDAVTLLKNRGESLKNSSSYQNMIQNFSKHIFTVNGMEYFVEIAPVGRA